MQWITIIDICSKNVEHRLLNMPRQIAPLLLFLLTFCIPGRAQQAPYVESLHSVQTGLSTIRAGIGSSANQLIAVLSPEKSIKVYDATNLSEWGTFQVGNVAITDFVFGKRAPILYSARATGQIDIWDLTKKQKINELSGSNTTVLGLVEESQQRLLAAGFDRAVRLIDIASGKTLVSTSAMQDDIRAVAVVSSGTKAIVVTEHGWIYYLSLPGLIELKKLESHYQILSAAFSSEGKWMALGGPEGTVRLWDVEAGTVRSTFEDSKRPIAALAFDLKNRWLVTASADSIIRIYDLSKNTLAKSLAVQDGYATATSFVNPELLWAGTSKGTIKTWRVFDTPPDTIPPVISFVQFGEPMRVYGTSVRISGLVRDKSNLKEILVDGGAGTLQVTDAAERDRVPGMATKAFVLDAKLEKVGANAFSLKAVDESNNAAHQSVTVQRLSSDQAIEIISPPNNYEADKVSTKLEFKLWCATASYQVLVNLAEATDMRAVQQKPPGEVFSEEIPLVIGYNQVQINVVAKNGEKLTKTWGVSRKVYGTVSATTVSKPVSKERGVEPQLWAVIVGISEYENKTIPPLHYADADAEAFADFLRKPEGGGFAPDHMRVLVNKDATLANLKIAFVEFLSQAIDKDLVMIFFAGHGAPDPARPANLFFLTHDTDPSRLGTTAYPMWDMRTLLERQLSAKRIVVFSDACHSGGISTDYVTRGVNTSESNGVNQYLADLARSKEGIVMFTASAAGEVSQEFPDLGHGVFTYYLLEGMRGEADLNNDYTVTINELMQYVEDQVKRKTRGAQNPTRSQTIYDKDLTISKIAH
jgi:hypothetical protein